MNESMLVQSLAGVLAAAAPVLFAVTGETICERAGIINLSMNGTILLSAMGGFAVAVATGSPAAGFAAGAAIGAGVAALIAFASVTLRLSQVATGFVLALLCRDLAYFLGAPLMGLPGPRLAPVRIPLAADLPVLGPLFFRHDPMTYLCFLLAGASWYFMFRTAPGLSLRAIGEAPAAARARGVPVIGLRYLYAIIGGAVAGLSGPMFSLAVKAGWKGSISGIDGTGWIALAITIFGGWNPLRAAGGALLFSLLQWLGLVLQPAMPSIPSQVFQVAPFPLMILTLLLVNVGRTEWLTMLLARSSGSSGRVLLRALRTLNVTPPASLGVPFEPE